MIQMHSKVAIRQRPYITGKVIDVNGQVVTIEYDDAQLIPRTGQHFQSELITLASTMEGVHEGYWYPPAYEYSEPACTCGLDSVYGESHNYGHSDYCEKGKKI